MLSMLSKDLEALKGSSRPKAFAMPAGFSGCAFWRFRLPIWKLMERQDRKMDVIICDNPDKLIQMKDVQWSSENCDVIHMQSPGGRDCIELMHLYHAKKKGVLIDYDDYSFDLSPGNPRYAQLGIKECDVLDEEGKKIFEWRDGQNGFNLEENLEKYNAFLETIKMADAITTTTDYLADRFRPYNPNVIICPNAIDLDRWVTLPRPTGGRLDGQVRIGYFGGDSHYTDIRLFKTLLPRLCAKYPQVKIVLQCPPVKEWGEIFKNIPPAQMEWYNWVDLRYYPLFLASRYWDIGLIPLDTGIDREFNMAKSAIKWMEFTAIGAAVVAQNMIPYAPVIKNGETGILANTEEEWFEACCKLIEDRVKRTEMAQAALSEVRARHNLADQCLMWDRAYASVLEKTKRVV